MRIKFTAVYQKRDKWYAAYIEEIPGVNTQGRTLKEAKENLKEALRLILQANKEIKKEKPPESVLKEPIEITIK